MVDIRGCFQFFDWKLNNMRHFGWYNSLRLSLNIRSSGKTASLFEFAIFIHNLPTLHHLRVLNLQCKNLHPSGVHWCTSIQALIEHWLSSLPSSSITIKLSQKKRYSIKQKYFVVNLVLKFTFTLIFSFGGKKIPL